jgi:hypothetical protein
MLCSPNPNLYTSCCNEADGVGANQADSDCNRAATIAGGPKEPPTSPNIKPTCLRNQTAKTGLGEESQASLSNTHMSRPRGTPGTGNWHLNPATLSERLVSDPEHNYCDAHHALGMQHNWKITQGRPYVTIRHPDKIA